VGRLRRAKFAAAMGSSTIAVANILREHGTQVTLVEDQHTVGQFGSEGAYESLGDTVHPRATRMNPHLWGSNIGLWV
jgi:hypothetical protein